MSKLVVIVQCAHTLKRCSGYNCMNAFYNKAGKFESYPDDTRYLAMDCGGCCGAGIAAKLENLQNHIKKTEEENLEVAVHLASCIISDNYHKTPCPFKNYLENMLKKHNFKTIVKGTYISKKTSAKREDGSYKCFE